MTATPQTAERALLLTANDLLDGDIVFLTEQGDWTRRLREARRFLDKQEAEARLAEATRDETRVIGAELAELRTEADDALAPAFTRLRDAIRAEGPTTHPALGRSTGR